MCVCVCVPVCLSVCLSVCYCLISETAIFQVKVSILMERSPYVIQTKICGDFPKTFSFPRQSSVKLFMRILLDNFCCCKQEIDNPTFFYALSAARNLKTSELLKQILIMPLLKFCSSKQFTYERDC